MANKFRTEHDFLGEREIPDDVYYGIQTLRAKENFDITGLPASRAPRLIKAFGYVKKAAALANFDCGVLDREKTDAICYAADRLIAGEFNDQFVTDLIQGGAGTSCNMNANEVIANIGLEQMGHRKGEYEHLHPNNHVNCSQSTNDAYPTALRLALYMSIGDLVESMEQLQRSFARKGDEFKDLIKMGRTQLQDAVPMTLGREFHAFATTIGDDLAQVKEARCLISETNMGATAIGTGVNAPERYAEKCTEYLKQISGIPVTLAADLVEATGISGKLILKWVNHADLYRIKGVGSEYADLLEAAGVDTVMELAQRNPANLLPRMLEVNEEKKLVRRTPVQSQVDDWVGQAKTMQRVIQY